MSLWEVRVARTRRSPGPTPIEHTCLLLNTTKKEYEEFERWAHDMIRRGFTAWQVASKAGTSETRVTQAYHREEARRDAERG